MEEFKQIQRAVWESGDFPALAPYISGVGEHVVAAAAVEPGMDVLDVACGTGNAALPAARAGARVTGLDLAPKLLEAGREKAEAEGLDLQWVEGDAEDLPFEDASFERVLSTFGHMFAPRHRRTADEMARVCRPGGVIVTATWLAEGTVGKVFATSAPYMPPPPDFAQPPVLWGSEDYVRDMWGGAADEFTFDRGSATIEWDSVEGFADFFVERFGPLVTARRMLGDRFAELRERLVGVWKEANRSGNGGFVMPQEYLVSVVRLKK